MRMAADRRTPSRTARDELMMSDTIDILLIEDDWETASEISGDLSERGYRVVHADTGSSGLAICRGGRFDLLIIDRMLPELDGLAVIEILRREAVRTPVLVLSALSAVNDRVRGLKAGGDDYLTKPFALEELAARVEALLRRPLDIRGTILRIGSLELDLIARKARRGERRSSCCRGNSKSSNTS
jgi:two-component system OmpR family response regulator